MIWSLEKLTENDYNGGLPVIEEETVSTKKRHKSQSQKNKHQYTMSMNFAPIYSSSNKKVALPSIRLNPKEAFKENSKEGSKEKLVVKRSYKEIYNYNNYDNAYGWFDNKSDRRDRNVTSLHTLMSEEDEHSSYKEKINQSQKKIMLQDMVHRKIVKPSPLTPKNYNGCGYIGGSSAL